MDETIEIDTEKAAKTALIVAVAATAVVTVVVVKAVQKVRVKRWIKKHTEPEKD